MIKTAPTVFPAMPPDEQQAWHWWHAQQQQRQQQQADAIRDGVLQQAFGFRRYLEQLGGGAATPEPSWLDRFNQLYHQLEALSDELLPPFVEDSLSLALQRLLSHGPAPIPLQAPICDRALPVASNQTILAVVAELLPVLKTFAQPWQAHLTYADEGQILRFSYRESDPTLCSQLQQSAEISYLQAIFHSLTSGTLEINPGEINPGEVNPDRTGQLPVELSCQLTWPVPCEVSGDV